MSEAAPDLEPVTPHLTIPFPVVGVGASAGGLKALLDLFGAMPPDTGMAFVVILHLSPEHESHMDELLRKVTPIPVLQVTTSVPIEADRIYVISPKSSLWMRDGHLEPTPQAKRDDRRTTIDLFFETLADAHRHRAMGIVLSGSGSDGTRGAKSLKAHGGVVLVQDPAEAQYDTMPQSAIASGAADFVLAVRDMPQKLAALWDNAAVIRLPSLDDESPAEANAAYAEDALREVLALTRARTRHDFSQYKRPTLLRRIERRLQVNQLPDLPSYRDYVREHAEESKQLLRDLLISVTAFFRDRATFDALASMLVPKLFAEAQEGSNLRIWVVGCATGEEVYSLAMLLAEHAARLETSIGFNLFATDIDEPALAFARTALYPETIVDQVSAERLQRFFVKERGGYRVQKALRETVMFATHNVLQDAPFSKLDLVACRNLLIYLDRDAQRRVLDLVHFALRPEGYLVLGRSETVDQSEGFSAVDASNRIYRQRPLARTAPITAPWSQAARAPGEQVMATVRRRVYAADLHQQLLELYAPPSVVVDDRYEILHLSQSAGRYLRFGPGEPSSNVLDAVPEELRFELRNVLDHAMQSMETVESKYLPLRIGADFSHVDVKVHPLRDRTSSHLFALVLFTDVDEQRDKASEGTVSAVGGSVARKIETRLRDAEARLRNMAEEYAVQNEEAKAANEELQATNEELRATGEELETGKEELQAVNEELSTVNQELKQRIDEATRASDDLRNFINATRIAVLFVDVELKLLLFTPTARELFNVIDADIGRPLLDITHRLADTALEADIRGVIDTLKTVERQVRSADGRAYQLRILPYRTVDDRIRGAVLTFVDISARRDAEAAVRRSESWLKLLIDSVRDYAVVRLDPEGRIMTWNPAAALIFGYQEAEVMGRGYAMLFTPEDQASGIPASALATARDTGRAAGDLWMQRGDGERFYASGVTAPLLEDGTIGYVLLLRNLTDEQVGLKQLLENERDSRERAQEATRMKDQFLATLSHELRNPLALILMQSELLLGAPEVQGSKRLANAAAIIHQMVHAQAQFVSDMLDVTRLQAGKLALDRQLLPLSLVIADSVGGLRRDAEQNDITLELDFTPEPLFVEADAVRVRQIAWNLLSNALKFTPRGGHVIARLRRDNNFARFEVEDTGQGIATELLPKIFEWFRQGESGSTRRQGGMGIGLALVKQLVELHGGRVEAHSAGVGKGARFTVCLPLQTPGVERVVAPVAATPYCAAGRLDGLRILVIDDLPDSAESMRQLLEIEGANVTAETRAHAAIEHAHAESFDVIISDIAMPGMDGHAMLREIRASPLNAKTPAIAHSGYGGQEDTARSLAAGFQLHLTKPIGLEQLLEGIDTARKQQVPIQALSFPPALSAARRSAD